MCSTTPPPNGGLSRVGGFMALVQCGSALLGCSLGHSCRSDRLQPYSTLIYSCLLPWHTLQSPARPSLTNMPLPRVLCYYDYSERIVYFHYSRILVDLHILLKIKKKVSCRVCLLLCKRVGGWRVHREISNYKEEIKPLCPILQPTWYKYIDFFFISRVERWKKTVKGGKEDNDGVIAGLC